MTSWCVFVTIFKFAIPCWLATRVTIIIGRYIRTKDFLTKSIIYAKFKRFCTINNWHIMVIFQIIIWTKCIRDINWKWFIHYNLFCNWISTTTVRWYCECNIVCSWILWRIKVRDFTKVSIYIWWVVTKVPVTTRVTSWLINKENKWII